MEVSKHILEELEFSPGYCDRKYSDEKLGPGTYVLFKDHHNYDGFVFKSETFEQFAMACRAMVLMRFNYRWYPDKILKMPEPPYTEEEIASTPKKLQSFVTSEMKRWNRARMEVLENNDFVYMAEVACSDHEYANYAAVLIVERRQDHEDEEWNFSKLLDPYKYYEKIEAGLKKKKKVA